MTLAVGNNLLVGMGQVHVEGDCSLSITARSLGSTAAVALYDPEARIGGILHWMLPDSAIAPDRALRSPGLFADTGFEALTEQMVHAGARLSRCTAALAGAASLPEGGSFDVGCRNREAAHRILGQSGVRIICEETGGVSVRDLSLEIANGRIHVRGADV